jgi:hypothetical protein
MVLAAIGFRCQCSGVRIWRLKSLTPETPYDIKFLLRFDWTLAASGSAYMKLHIVKKRTAEYRMSNVECRSVECGFALLSHL